MALQKIRSLTSRLIFGCVISGKHRINFLKLRNQNSSYCTAKGVNNTEIKLIELLRHQIKLGGPMTVANYMKQVLINPTGGYYTSKGHVIGKEGDFITSPEISQMFGELIAVWCLHEWMKLNRPKPLQIVELGPGTGTLMDDMCRVFSRFPDIIKDFSIHFIELSPTLVKSQETKLCGSGTFKNDVNFNSSKAPYHKHVTKNGIPISWYRYLDDVPPEFTIYIAHEFLDALPIHKFQKVENKWHEVLIDVDDTKPDGLRFILSRGSTPSHVLISQNETRDHVEVGADAAVMASNIAKRMEEDGGFALFIDYGHDGTKSDTFRAFKQHKLHDPLSEPGTADLTADVDFSFIRKAVQEKAVTFGPVTQEHFFKEMEIETRLKKLLQSNPKNSQDLILGYKKLTSPTEMGERFKAFSMFPLVLKECNPNFVPAGF